MQIWTGQSYPLGATFDGSGTNFALFSDVSERVELCLTDEDCPERRVEITEVDAYGWHLYLPAVRLPGARPVRSGSRAPLRPLEAAAGPLREGDRRDGEQSPVAVQLRLRGPRVPQHGRLRRAHHALGGGLPVLRLGQRPPAGP